MWNKQVPGESVLIPSSNGHSISVKFTCDRCNAEVITDTIGVPTLDLLSEYLADNHSFETEEVTCPKCGKHHNVTITSELNGTKIEVSDVKPEEVYYQQIH